MPDNAMIDIRKGTVKSSKPVAIKLLNGDLNANKLEILVTEEDCENNHICETGQNKVSYSIQKRKKTLEELLEDLEVMREERDKLREAMNEAVDKCSAYIILEKELKEELEKKEK